MSKTEKTSRGVASTASQVLRNSASSATQRSLAGSALAQSGTTKTTSKVVAQTASRALDDGRSSKVTRSLAGSVLTQKSSGKK